MGVFWQIYLSSAAVVLYMAAINVLSQDLSSGIDAKKTGSLMVKVALGAGFPIINTTIALSWFIVSLYNLYKYITK